MNTEVIQSAGDLAPVAANKRIDIMDILRGFALIGIILMNIEWFNRAIADLGGFDVALKGGDWSAGWFVRLFVEGKFYKLFCLLFGMGFAVMLLKAQEVGRPFGAWFSRRMIILFLFGMGHMIFLWGGDILHNYAVGGLVMLAWIFAAGTKRMQRFNNPRSFLRFGLFVICLPIVVAIGAGIFFGSTRSQTVIEESYQQHLAVIEKAIVIEKDEVLSADLLAKDKALEESGDMPEEVDEDAMSPEDLVQYKAERYFVSEHNRLRDKAEEVEAFTQGSYWVATEFRVEKTLEALKGTLFFATLVCFPLFLIGYWFIASGVLKTPQNHLALFKTMAWLGLSIGFFCNVAALLIMAHPVTKDAMELNAASNVLFGFGQYILMAGYVGGMVLLSLTERGHRWLSWLAPMGRMALTNYIMNSIVLSSIFFGYAGGLYGQISRLPQMGIVAGVLIIQFLFSIWWLKHFKFGPLEWLWRSLTYLKVQPMRI
jgi:uncharacterized protein